MISGPHPSPVVAPVPSTAVRRRIEVFCLPPWQAIKEWIPDDEPDLDWFNRPRNPQGEWASRPQEHESNDGYPDPDWFDQLVLRSLPDLRSLGEEVSPAWKAPEVPLDDGRTLVLEST